MARYPRVPCWLPLGAMIWVAVVWSAAIAWCTPTDDRIHFQRLTPTSGLPAAVVYSIVQDSRGFLWFGTADGIARFDGQEFRVFRPDPADPDSLANPSVLAIQEDLQGDLWIATDAGLDLWHRDTERFSHFRHDPADATSLSEDSLQSLLLDPDGSLWVGTLRSGLNRFDPRAGKCQRFLPAAGRSDTVNDPWIRCLFRDRHGMLWIGTGAGGLNRFDPATQRFRVYAHDPADPRSLSHNRISAIAEDDAGDLWIGTDDGLCRFDSATQSFDRFAINQDEPSVSRSRTVTGVMVDREGIIWVGTDGGGLCRFDPATRAVVRHEHSPYLGNTLATNAVRALFEDRDGDFWIGHFPAGVSHFDRVAAGFQVFSREPGETNTLSDDHVLSFWEDPSGDLWVGTDNGGLNHWNAATGEWKWYRHSAGAPESIGGKAATSVLRDHRGRLWAGTWDGGLARFRPEDGTFQRYLPETGRADSLSDAHAWQLAEDQAHNLWIATIGGGLDRYVPQTDGFEHQRHDPANPRSLNDDIVSALLVAKNGDLWVGTPKGLARWAPATRDWDRFQRKPGQPPSIGDHWIFDLVDDRDGTIWATSEGGGLYHLDPRTGRCENFRVRDGLPSDVLRGILQDDDGMLWIGSNRGLARLDPRTRNIRVFDESNGLPDSLFTPHGRLRLASGAFLFGTTRGFVRFDPRALPVDTRPPPVAFTGFQVFDEWMRPGRPDSPLTLSISETRRLEIPARLSVISFQFAAVTFRSIARVQYRFRLEGFDDVWRTPGPGRRVTFTNLDPGLYRLRVKAANGAGVWNSEGATLDLTIVPPWWRTRWFTVGVVLAVLASAAGGGGTIAAARSRRLQRDRELAAERERAQERAEAAEALRVLNLQLEQRVVERTTQLSTAVKELEAFSYSVSHDLRAPLRSMDGFSRVLLEDYGDRLGEEAKDSLTRIRAASQRMGQLIDDLLMLSRVSRDEMHLSPVDLSAIATAIADELRRNHPDRRIEFVIAPNLRAQGDARLLRIALENLLGNACKFSGGQPLARIEFGSGSDARGTVFHIRDNGAGFDMTHAHKLFGAFQRFHTAAEFPGTGIGLATVQRIIHRHGGRIWAESQPGHGATFFFILPEHTSTTP